MHEETTNHEQSRVATDCPNEHLVMCGRCKNCAHWEGQEYEGMKTCDHDSVSIGYYGTPQDVGPAGLLIEGDEGWGWYTGPEFGCIHFKQKNT